MTVHTPRSPLSYECDPLSHPYASFNGHSSWSAPSKPRLENGISQADSSEDAQAREAETALREKVHVNGNAWAGDEDGEPEADRSSLEAARMKPPSPRVNPFHLFSHPESTSPVPPFLPHLQALASDTGDPTQQISQSSQDFIQRLAEQSSVDHGQPPVHITRVTPDTVTVRSGPAITPAKPQRILDRVSSAFKKEPRGETLALPDGLGEDRPAERASGMPRLPVIMQGPPPSPPISEVEVVEDGEDSSSPSSSLESETAESGEPNTAALPPLAEATESDTPFQTPRPLDSPTMYTSNLTSEPFELAPSISGTGQAGAQSHLGVPAARQVSNSSTVSRAGSLAVVRCGRLAPQRDAGPSAGSRDAQAKAEDGWTFGKSREQAVLPDEDDGFPVPQSRKGSGGSLSRLSSLVAPLPSSVQPPRIFRRSTNPTSYPNPQRSPLVHSHSTFLPSPIMRSQTMVPGLDGAALDSDILLQSEAIRRERLERRQKRAGVKDNLLEGGEIRRKSEMKEPKKMEEARVLVGNLIGEDHVNYVLMYNMLTGIRIGVSRCQAKVKRPLTEEDFGARHKFSFDIVGNELTPSARYDFKFKDYAPWVFRDLRDEHFHLDPADYLLSLTAKYILSELGSPGKSGSFFYFSRDYRFIIKTISHCEHKFLRSILKDYHTHVKNNPHTLLSRFYGLHRVKLPRGRKIHFVIMNNLFPPHRDIHETYDLKGSALGREYPEEKAKKNPRAVLKDKNWVNRGRTLELGPEKRALLSEQLKRDMEFLKKVRVMDYSLLVGIHNMERGNRDNLRENQLIMFHPEVPPVRRKPSAIKGPSEASNVRKAIRRSDPKMLDVVSQLPTADSADRRHFLFYQDEGGLRATDEANVKMDAIYYLGIIDICTPYDTVKKIEHAWKSMTEDRITISCQDPVVYGQRFLNFLLSVMRGGDVNLRPSGLSPHNNKVDEKPVGGEKSPNESDDGVDRRGEGVDAPTARAMVGHLKAE